jgi:hypothetical protein
MSPDWQSSIHVIAGVNGAAKSSIGGAMVRKSGADYYNPDEAAYRLIRAYPGLPQEKRTARLGIRA